MISSPHHLIISSPHRLIISSYHHTKLNIIEMLEGLSLPYMVWSKVDLRSFLHHFNWLWVKFAMAQKLRSVEFFKEIYFKVAHSKVTILFTFSWVGRSKYTQHGKYCLEPGPPRKMTITSSPFSQEIAVLTKYGHFSTISKITNLGNCPNTPLKRRKVCWDQGNFL